MCLHCGQTAPEHKGKKTLVFSAGMNEQSLAMPCAFPRLSFNWAPLTAVRELHTSATGILFPCWKRVQAARVGMYPGAHVTHLELLSPLQSTQR